ncbi:DUF4922 domain-containing protein [Marinobacterium nitratireducens]|nr:DUF4922 domain-containing protein [Marinobacterium nitratireducens]
MTTIWQQAARTRAAAIACGALKPIATESLEICEHGIPFVIRVLSSLRDKSQALERLHQAADRHHNPFLTPEPELLVSEVPPAHRCILNKFCVIDRHLLLVTRDFEPQSRVLNRQDFAALATCMRQGPALAFFNGGPDAGASQPHKHLQMLPLDKTAAPPFGPLLDDAATRGLGQVPQLPFRHRLVALPQKLLQDTTAAAEWLNGRYRSALDALGIEVSAGSDVRQAYNLLLTARWMLLVPRLGEKSGEVSVNALGFVGWLLVKRRKQAECLQAQGLMDTLIAVSGSGANRNG